MKGSLISLILTALLVTSLFQPHQHIAAASQNNTNQGTNGCIGLQCLIVDDKEGDLFMDQLVAGSSRMLAGAPPRSKALPTVNPGETVCKVGTHRYGSTCLPGAAQYNVDSNTRTCEALNRVDMTNYPCRR